MQTITSTPKVSLSGTSLVQITDGAGNLTNVSTDSVNANLQRISGAVLAATNAIPSRLTDGSAYYDARQIRALTNSDVVKAQLQDNAGTGVTLGQKAMTASLPVTMASDQKPGIPSLQYASRFTKDNQAYGCGIPAVNAPTKLVDNPVVLIRNPSGSGKVCYIRRINAGNSAAEVIFRVWAAPTVTANGTAITTASLNVGGGAGAASILIYKTPTVTANGVEISNGVNYNVANSFIFDLEYEVQIQANNFVLITANPASANTSCEISLRWVEL